MPPVWQAELAAAYTRPEDLLRFLEIDAAAFPNAGGAAQSFPFRVTESFAARMRKGDPGDPLLRQVMPLAAETADPPGFSADPVGDLDALAEAGLLHKYHGRVLLIVTAACAIHCRYCFRREFPYSENRLSRAQEAKALDYIAAHTEIQEVILSGGDPLALSDARIQELISGIVRIAHVERLRIHTRLPVVLPSRIGPELLDSLGSTRLRPVVVIHCNHPAELDRAVGQALAKLKEAGITLLNQTVLLKGVNDDAATLIRLSEALFSQGVLPYYLHLLDRARGTAHFEVSEDRAGEILEELRARLPGYLVPRLVREVAGQPYKMPVLFER